MPSGRFSNGYAGVVHPVPPSFGGDQRTTDRLPPTHTTRFFTALVPSVVAFDGESS